MIMMIEQFPKVCGKTQLNFDIKLRDLPDEKARALFPRACQSFAGALNDRGGYALP